MSEHPELREALIDTLATFHMDDYDADRADALLALPAGTVGKLQAELAEAKAELAQLREEKTCQFVIRSDEGTAYCSLAERPDPERIRREAIGAWVLAFAAANPSLSDWSLVVDLDDLLAAGESAVTGEAT